MIPCAPEGSPVPSETMLVAVVVGKPARIGVPASEFRNGACSALRASKFAPIPSTSRITVFLLGCRSRRFASPLTPREASTDGASVDRVGCEYTSRRGAGAGIP